jgi:MbtH protein
MTVVTTWITFSLDVEMPVEEKMQNFLVVLNAEEQYSIWPSQLKVPNGWRAVGPTGEKPVCLEYIERVWTDMRPKSLRDIVPHIDQ